MITEQKLERLGFHKIMWNNVCPEYYLLLHEKTGDWFVDSQGRIGIRFDEVVIGPKFRVFLCVGQSILNFPHIKTVERLLHLYTALTGKEYNAQTTQDHN